MATDNAVKSASSKQSNPAASAAEVVTPNWDQIALDYRAGLKTLRQIGKENGISHTYINKRAKQEGWERDLSAKIHAKAEQLVSKSVVSKAVTTETMVTERRVIEANAEAIATVRLSHRTDIQRARSIVMNLFDELQLQSGAENAQLLEQLGELMRAPDDNGQDKLNDLYHKIISLSGRSKTMKDLGESLRVLIALERQAFGLVDGAIDDAGNPAVKHMTDAERAVRMARLVNGNPDAFAAMFGALAK